jgi:hypothetical protein
VGSESERHHISIFCCLLWESKSSNLGRALHIYLEKGTDLVQETLHIDVDRSAGAGLFFYVMFE